MANRVRVALNGFGGAPGVATFYGTDLAALRSALTNLWGGLCALPMFPSTFTATIETQGDVINSATGIIEGQWNAPAIAPATSGTGPGAPYSGVAGATIRWNTGTIADGSRVVGRTFLVPMVGTAFDSLGNLNDSLRLQIEAIAATFVSAAAPGFVIWHRPRAFRAATVKLRELPAHAGSLAVVTGSSVKDMTAVLRSRRQ